VDWKQPIIRISFFLFIFFKSFFFLITISEFSCCDTNGWARFLNICPAGKDVDILEGETITLIGIEGDSVLMEDVSLILTGFSVILREFSDG